MIVEKTNRKLVSKNKLVGQFILLIVLIIIFSTYSNALTLVAPTSKTIAENTTLIFDIYAENGVGTINFSMTSQNGVLTRINDSYMSYSWTPDFSDSGTYTIEFTAIGVNGSGLAQTIITVSNTNIPISIISNTNPGTIDTSTTEINITTDKSADCKYDVENKNYAVMTYSFTNENAEETIHKGITPSLSQGAQKIYVECMDEYQNTLASTFVINYTINLKPTASITLNPSSPINTETVTIHLTTSESLIDTPELKYYFDDNSALRSITLIGSGQSWEGYMIIPDTGNNRIGTFTFKGVDLTNVEGTKITSGKIFMVDTKKPVAIRSIAVNNQDDRIELLWDYSTSSNSEINEYHIYRKVGSGGVDYLDYYKTTRNENYYDYNVDYNQAYYYRVAAVDDAGNEGDLSKEVYITHTPVTSQNTSTSSQTTTQTPVTSQLDSKLQYQLSIKERSIEKTLFDIAEIETKIGQAKGTDKISVIQALGILSKIKEQKNKIINSQKDLNDLKNYDLSTEEFNQRSEEILQDVFSAWKETPQDVKIVDSSTYKEEINDQKTADATSIFLQNKGVDLDADKLALLIDQNKKLQDGLTIDVSVIKSIITYPKKEETYITVEKIISSNSPINNAQIIETIPKSFATSVSELSFSEDPNVLQDDPVVVWSVDLFSKKTIVYSVKKDINIVDAKTVKTIVLTTKDLDTAISSGGPTGMTISQNSTSNSPYFIPIIVGILIIGALAAYYFFSSEERNIDSFGGVGKKLFNFNSMIKRRNEKIIPQEYDEYKDDNKLSFENLSSKNKDFIHSTPDSKNASLIINKIQQFNQSNDFKTTNQKIKDIQKIYDQLSDYSDYTSVNNELNLSDVQFIQQNTLKMRVLLDEIEKKNLETYTDNAKETLKYALMYMTRKDAKDKSDLEDETFKSVKKDKKLTDYDSEKQTLKDEKEKIKEESKITKDKDLESSKSLYDIECDDEKAFVLSNGVRFKSIGSLLSYVHFMDDEVFKSHVNESKNDFSNWILEVFDNKILAEKISKLKSKEELKKIIEK